MLNIRFKNLEIRQVASSSGVFSGENRQKGFVHASKEIQGIGSIDGKFNNIKRNIGMTKADKLYDESVQENNTNM